MTEDELRGLFREMRDEPVPADSLARVRIGLEARLQRRGRAWPWAALAFAACGLLLAAVLFPHRSIAPPAKPQPVVANEMAQRPPEITAPVETPRPARFRRVRYRARRPEAKPAVIRIETENPDIVILLLGD